MMPIDRVRCSKIGLPSTRSSNVSQLSNTLRMVLAALGDPAPRQVVLEAADAVEVRVEAPAGDGLDEVEHVLAVAEAVEGGRDRADLQPHLAEEQQERRDPRELGEDRADPLRARRRLDAHELLGRVDERHLVREARQPVDAVDERRDLRVGAVLGELLVAAVHVADDRVGRDHALAVEPHDEPQRAVRRRVLRAERQDHVAGVELDVHLRVGEVAVDAPGRSGPRAARPDRAGRWWSPTHLPPSRRRRRPLRPACASTSTRPGHGFTSRASSGKSLRSGWPSNSAGR